jgi:hypothetical protein
LSFLASAVVAAAISFVCEAGLLLLLLLVLLVLLVLLLLLNLLLLLLLSMLTLLATGVTKSAY